MDITDAKQSNSASLLRVANDTVSGANSQIQYCAKAVRELGTEVRYIAEETVEVLFSIPSQVDIETRMREVLKQYSSVLCGFSARMDDVLTKLNRAWMDVDQALGFYLVSKGRDEDANPEELRQLIDLLTQVREQTPGTRKEIKNLSSAIKSSAGGLDGLEEAIAESTDTLERLNGELDLGSAVITRHIILAERLHDLLNHTH